MNTVTERVLSDAVELCKGNFKVNLAFFIMEVCAIELGVNIDVIKDVSR